MSTVSDYYTDRADVSPLASGDADILQDITFSGYSTGAEFTTANTDWVINGANVTWDTTGGTKVGSGSSLTTTLASIETDLLAANEGSIYFEVERSGITVDEGDIAGNFLQSTGRVGATTVDFLLNTSSGATDFIKLSRQPGTTASGQMRLTIKANNGTTQNIDFYVNSQREFDVTDDEHTYAKIIATFKSKTVTVIVDGLPVITATLDNEFTTSAFSRITVGNQALLSPGHFGDYFIRRIQITKRQSFLVANPMRVCFGPGDSFLASFTDGVDINSLADVQKLSDGSGRAGYKSGLYSFLRRMAVDHNFVLTNVTGFHDTTASMNGSTENGAGFSSSGAVPFTSELTNYIIGRNPEVIITAGSWNDVNDASPAPDIYGDTKAILDTIIDGCRNLRQIHFFAQFAGFKGLSTKNNDAHRAEAERLRSEQRALNGYTRSNAAGETVKVFFHETYELWGGDDYSPELSIGSATGNTVTPNADQHPSSLGSIKMGEIIYNATEPYITTVPKINN